MKSRALLLTLMALLTTSAFAETPDPSFSLTATAKDFANYFPGQLANGYFSTMTAPRGTEGNLAYMVAFMDYAKDDASRPAAIPGWTEVDYSTGNSSAGHFWMNQVDLSPAVFQEYSQTLDLHDATLTTHYRYLDHGKATRVEVTTLVSQASPHLAATRVSFTPEFDGEVELSFALNTWAPYEPRFALGKITGEQMQEQVASRNMKLQAIPPATADRAPLWYHGDTHVLHSDGDTQDMTLSLDGRAEQGLRMAEAAAIELPAGLKPREATFYKSDYRLALNLRVSVRKGVTYTFTKYVAASRESWGGDADADMALAKAAREKGFESLLDAHKDAWHTLWQTDVRIDGDAKAQQIVHADLYYLLSNSTRDTAWPIGACAMTPGYLGHAFWDSDSWVFPALLLLHPQRAKSLVMFRSRTLPAAQQRASERHLQGAMYPWEADPQNGTEQTPHFAYVLGEREIHVNADIAIAQWQYYLASGDKAWLKQYGWPVIRNVAEFWASRATWNVAQKRYDILHVTSVDEDYNDVPNDTFTNVSAVRALEIATAAAGIVGEHADPHWTEVAKKMHVPFSAADSHHLDFDESVPHDIDSWGGSSLPMLSYPSLDFPMDAGLRRRDFDYAVSPIARSHHDPNSMGLAPMSIAAATLGDAAGASAWFDRNITANVIKPPFDVRTETANNNTGYFLTASAGLMQNIVYGFSGLRIQPDGLTQAYAPVLPSGWKSLTLKRVTWRGKLYDITVQRDAAGKVQLTRKAL
ncbi:glycosyl hydrolase family 65 protein [Rhodanobacter sp. L36]|uniref:glycosyl hydrolase family 65 protein n=1 Tax=Rhodanobacter sp. L36 TaxID=1747221 RepID=UPI00131D0E00|nr:glycosyl hydrolase family 65 protein [Rhodanobacter sp. L36]